ncbi:hypothetical protein B0H14DRAFT_2591212 [Mycena olivaceomarginata]|nr:hypothetical protein B0H14DRAFT_2591212 [Mycena olivaceomarginata]
MFTGRLSIAIPAQGALSSCQARDRVLVETRNVTVAGQDIQISVLNACVTGIGPLESDCATLEAALPAAIAAAGGPTSFTVPPQFVQEFTLGTCLWAWFNTNPLNGATLQYCYDVLEIHGKNLDLDCITRGDTGGFAIPNNPQLNPVVLAEHLFPWVEDIGKLSIFLRTNLQPLQPEDTDGKFRKLYSNIYANLPRLLTHQAEIRLRRRTDAKDRTSSVSPPAAPANDAAAPASTRPSVRILEWFATVFIYAHMPEIQTLTPGEHRSKICMKSAGIQKCAKI